ncbi:ATPase, T2SS/T4P/T4SS family [Pseudodesulfovibrio senegalensis]|uniref:ATP-binding cassette domain-containing protein n=1 Tax=Pseudodesulfovibrio senegalensis TaxID=1721087 RepID=A0A6N6N1B7_9BACT|nr:ATPase, T2SS/T4P/T4SS family [Pseudodesulfovibrio senegalensis]KAB1437306.1 ATP-binding cassette domain-containing protein [Pseudodesulfovibrio senegalensis]
MISASLRSSLSILEKYLKKDNVMDVCIQREGEVVLQTLNGDPASITIKDKKIKFSELEKMARQLATAKGQQFNDEYPSLATTLPEEYGGYRIQCVGSAICESGFSVTIRIAKAKHFPLTSYFSDRQCTFLAEAMRRKKTILILGNTGSGKTTLMNSLSREIPADWRIITIQDTSEIDLPHYNTVSLLLSKTGSDHAKISYEQAIDMSNRMRPDITLLGEIDSRNGFAFLNMVTSGHGGMSTIHATYATPENAIKRLAICGANKDHSYEDCKRLAREAIDVLITTNKKKNGTFEAKIYNMEGEGCKEILN